MDVEARGMRDRVVLRALREVWQDENRDRFGRAMRQPQLRLHDGRSRLGFWDGQSRSISLSRELAWNEPWIALCEVLLHEMAHQYVQEVLGAQETAHGPIFQRVCAERGIDARAAGLSRHDSDDDEEPVVLRRVRKLLARADGPDTGEARTASRLAWRLMARHGIQAAQLQERAPFEVRQLGPVARRHPAWRSLLVGMLCEHWGVEAIHVGGFDREKEVWGSVTEIQGERVHVEVALWVYDWFVDAAERAWRRHRGATGAKGVAAKNRFINGLVVGFRDHLRREKETARQEEGLVWRGDPELKRFLNRRYPTARAGGSVRIAHDEHFAAGRTEGEQMRWRQPVGSSTTHSGRSITDGQSPGGG